MTMDSPETMWVVYGIAGVLALLALFFLALLVKNRRLPGGETFVASR
jgi:hypothetical protein